jgi:hypothetical protein
MVVIDREPEEAADPTIRAAITRKTLPTTPATLVA